jgi:hypothetical protein
MDETFAIPNDHDASSIFQDCAVAHSHELRSEFNPLISSLSKFKMFRDLKKHPLSFAQKKWIVDGLAGKHGDDSRWTDLSIKFASDVERNYNISGNSVAKWKIKLKKGLPLHETNSGQAACINKQSLKIMAATVVTMRAEHKPPDQGVIDELFKKARQTTFSQRGGADHYLSSVQELGTTTQDPKPGPVQSDEIQSELGLLIKCMHCLAGSGHKAPQVAVVARKDMPDGTFFVARVRGLNNTPDLDNDGWLYSAKTRAGNPALWEHFFLNVVIPFSVKMGTNFPSDVCQLIYQFIFTLL